MSPASDRRRCRDGTRPPPHRRERFAINGAPVGREVTPDEIPLPYDPTIVPAGSGSIIVVIGTDAPLLPHQCNRLAQRAGFAVARTGGVGEHTSGDLFLCFATGNPGLSSGELGHDSALTRQLSMLSDSYITRLFDCVVEATEEAIINAILGAETMVGRDGVDRPRVARGARRRDRQPLGSPMTTQVEVSADGSVN